MQDQMDRMYQRSYLGRSMDPINYPYHRTILLLAVLAGVAGGILRLLTGADLLAAAIGGLYAGAAVFIAWVLARELDPDFEASAFAGAVLAFFAWVFLGNPAIIPLYVMILTLRMVNRTVGPPLKLGDSLTIFVGVLVAVFFAGGWVYGVIAALAFLLDAVLNEPNRRHWLFAALSLLSGIVVIFMRGLAPFEVPSMPFLFLALVTALLGFLLVFMIRQIDAVGDFSKQPLNLTRVRTGIVLAVFAVLAVLWYGDNGAITLAPLSAALVGEALYRVLGLFRRS